MQAFKTMLLNAKRGREVFGDITDCKKCHFKLPCSGIDFDDCPFGSLENIQKNLNYINNRSGK